MPVPIGSKAQVDALLAFDPPAWATDYNGTWLTTSSLLVTALGVSGSVRSDPVLRKAVAVGSMRVSVRPGANLTSLDRSSPPSNASCVVADGSWGDVVCDGGLYVYSRSAVVAAFSAPVNATYVPSGYTLTVSTSPTFPAWSTWTMGVSATQSELAVVLPKRFAPLSLRYRISFAPGAQLFVRVAASVPALPAQVARDLPQVVQPVSWPVDGCLCASVQSGSGCGDVAGVPEGLMPGDPVIGTSRGAWVGAVRVRGSTRLVGPLHAC